MAQLGDGEATVGSDAPRMATPRTLGRRLADVFELDPASRSLPMEGLRGIAVTLVFFVHYESLFGGWLSAGADRGIAGFLARVGHTGVDLFFVLSGYLIYGTVLRSRAFSYRRFLSRRVTRIFPTFLVMLAIYLGLMTLGLSDKSLPPGATPAAGYVLANVLLLPGLFHIAPIMTVAWSLSYEFFFYLLVPILVAALGLRARTGRARVGAMALVTAVFVPLSLAGVGRIQFLMFACGIFVYEAMTALREGRLSMPRAMRKSIAPLLVAALPMSFLLQSSALPHAFALRTVWLFAAFGLVSFAAFAENGRLARALSFTPLRWFGNMSYSYYLAHGLVLNAVALLAHHLLRARHVPPAAYWLAMPVAFAITVVACAVLFVAVEKRFSLHTSKPAAPKPVPATPAEEVRRAA